MYTAERTRRRSWPYYFWSGAGANALFVLGCFLIMIEGLICVVLALPLFSVLGGLGGLLMGAVCRWTRWPQQAVYCVTTLPVLFGSVEQYLPSPRDVCAVERSRIVPAAAEEIWRHLTVAEDILPSEISHAWVYRIGVPLPLAAVTELAGGEQIRHITMGKGIHFDQVAADWQPNRGVRWLYRFSSDSFPPEAFDDHVKIGGGYFDVLDTEYALRKIKGGTELRVRMTYRVSTPFNWYAKPIAQFLIGNFEEAALRFCAHRSQSDVR